MGRSGGDRELGPLVPLDRNNQRLRGEGEYVLAVCRAAKSLEEAAGRLQLKPSSLKRRLARMEQRPLLYRLTGYALMAPATAGMQVQTTSKQQVSSSSVPGPSRLYGTRGGRWLPAASEPAELDAWAAARAARARARAVEAHEDAMARARQSRHTHSGRIRIPATARM